MKTEAKASHDTSSPSQRSIADRRIYNYDSAKDKLRADLKVMVTDSQQLIKEAANSSAEGFATLRARFESKLVETRAKIDQTRAAVAEKTKHATDATQAYVKENPWKSTGVSVAAGLIFGLVLGRRYWRSD